MRKFETCRARGAAAACLLLAVAACALWGAGGAAAQSGRRRPAQQTTPQPTPEPEGESESGPRPRAAESRQGVVASFVVMGQDDSAFGVDSVTRSEVLDSFTTRLRRSVSVSVNTANRGTRGEAIKRAKSETEAHVVLLELEEDSMQSAPRGTSRADQRSLVVRTYVFEPKTGVLKYSDTIYQRAVRPSVGVGGVRLPIPTPTTGRYPSRLELRQAAQDAADRLLSRFRVAAPSDTP